MLENGNGMSSGNPTQRNDCYYCIVIEYVTHGTPSSEINEQGLDPRVDIQEVKRLVSQGQVMEFPNAEKLLVDVPAGVGTAAGGPPLSFL